MFQLPPTVKLPDGAVNEPPEMEKEPNIVSVLGAVAVPPAMVRLYKFGLFAPKTGRGLVVYPKLRVLPEVIVYVLVVPGTKELDTATVPDAKVLVPDDTNVTVPIAVLVGAVGAFDKVIDALDIAVTVVFAGI